MKKIMEIFITPHRDFFQHANQLSQFLAVFGASKIKII